MGNAALIYGKAVAGSKTKEFQSVVPFPPTSAPPSENSFRPSSRKRKPPAAVSPAPSAEKQEQRQTQGQSEAVSTASSAADPLVVAAAAALTSASSTTTAFPPSDFQFTEGQLRRESLSDCEYECSQITKFLFVGGQRVAENLELLREKEITRILNCALSVTPNYHEGCAGMTYLSLDLLDGRQEDISWFVCQAIHFVQEGVDRGEKVLMHCEKGVSRSCALAIAYRMWSAAEKWKAAYDFVKERRRICSPNIAFTCNLVELGEIFHGAAREADLLFRLAFHGAHDPRTAVLKVCRHQKSRRLLVPALSLLHPQAIFVLRGVRDGRHYLFLWRGQAASEEAYALGERLALQMRRVFASASAPLLKVLQGSEDDLFRSFLLLDRPYTAAEVEECTAFDDYFDLAPCSSTPIVAASYAEEALATLESATGTLPKILNNLGQRETGRSSQGSNAHSGLLALPPVQSHLPRTTSSSIWSGVTDQEGESMRSTRSVASILLPESGNCSSIPLTAAGSSNGTISIQRTVSGQDILERVSSIISSAAIGTPSSSSAFNIDISNTPHLAKGSRPSAHSSITPDFANAQVRPVASTTDDNAGSLTPHAPISPPTSNSSLRRPFGGGSGALAGPRINTLPQPHLSGAADTSPPKRSVLPLLPLLSSTPSVVLEERASDLSQGSTSSTARSSLRTQIRPTSIQQSSSVISPVDVASYLVRPKLFVARETALPGGGSCFEWSALGVYDDDDLDEKEIFLLLVSNGRHHLRAGLSFPFAQQQIALDDQQRPLCARLLKWAARVRPGDVACPQLVGSSLLGSDVTIDMSGEESQAFWDAFYEGS
eukprot:gene10194-11281_t